MRNFLSFLFAEVLFCSSISNGLYTPLLDSPCGDWIPYKNEKCVKLVDRAGFQTKEDAELVCEAFAHEFSLTDVPKLVTVKTEEKQNFLQKYLYEESGIFDSVWLGLDIGKDGDFQWNDGTDTFFTNWAKQNSKDTDHKCVQMESGEGAYEIGKWVRVNCKKKNAVVCERTQTWSVTALQNILLSLKLEVERNQQETERNKQEIESLKKNPVPLGFIYVQLPGQQAPTTLWPQAQWKDIGSQYAGLFFRVEGGEAAAFGILQEDNTRSLLQVQHAKQAPCTSIGCPWQNAPLIPSDGSWSQFTYSGDWATTDHFGLHFCLSKGEVRPRNKSMKIWQRVN